MNKSIKLLVAEDDENLGMLLADFLRRKGFTVDLAENGKLALEKFRNGKYDFCILDVMMPHVDGFTLATEIRAVDKQVPILFLTAKDLKEDKLAGFSIGADDYMTKPFIMDELLARIEAIMRRTQPVASASDGEYKIGKLRYQPDLRLLHTDEEVKKLTTKENQLLHLLVKNQNEILDRQATLRAVWGDDNYFNGRSMDVYIAKLRKMLKDDERIEIMNVHGQGFKLIVK